MLPEDLRIGTTHMRHALPRKAYALVVNVRAAVFMLQRVQDIHDSVGTVFNLEGRRRAAEI